MRLALVGCLAWVVGATAAAAQVTEAALEVCRDEWLGEFEVGLGEFGGTGSDAAEAIEAALADAARYFAGLGFKGPVLQCFHDPESDEYRFAVHYATEMGDSLGDYDSTRCGQGTAKARISLVDVATHYGRMIAGASADSDEISTPPHELFHAVQSSYSMFKFCPEDWVWEGLAEAMAYLWIQNYGPRNRQFTIKLALTPRYYDFPLHLPLGHDNPDSNTQAYGTALFWEYLTHDPKYVIGDETVSLGLSRRVDESLIVRFMDMRGTDDATYLAYDSGISPPKHWELKWLDKMLADAFNARLTKSQLNGGLYVIYPKFVSWLVDYVSADSLKHFFYGGCETVTLSADGPVPLAIDLAPVASACIAVSFPDASANKTFFVTAVGGEETIAAIHMGWDGGDKPPNPDESDAWRKSWLVLPAPDQETVYMAASNVSEVAAQSRLLAEVNLFFRFASKGEASR